MSRAIGMIEFKTTPAGITAADAMVKTSEVEIVEAQTVCPGKYIAIITGDLSAVKAAVDTAVTTYEDKCIDSFVLGNPHESIFPAIYGTTQVEEISALGILETYDAASIIEAADQAAKTAIVDLIELRIAKGMCGKSYMLLTGEVSAVEASIERAKELVAEKGMYMDSSVIAHPDKRMIDYDPLILSLYLRDILLKGIPAMTSEKEASYASIREKKSDSREITGREKGCCK